MDVTWPFLYSSTAFLGLHSDGLIKFHVQQENKDLAPPVGKVRLCLGG